MSEDIATLQIRVLTDQVEAANRRLASLEASGDRTEKSLDKVSKVSFRALASGLATAGVSLTALSAATGAATREWLGYDKAMKEVNSISGMTRAEFVGMRRDVLDLSVALGVDATIAARGLYQALSAGVPKDNAIEFLKVASKTAIAGVTSVDVAVDGLTNSINAFKIPVGEAEVVADKLIKTVFLGKTTLEELSTNLSKASVPAAALDVSLDELLGTVIGITKQGTPTSEAFTQVKATITALLDPSEELAVVYEQLGVASGRAAIQQFGFIGTLQAVRQAYDGNDVALVKALRSSEAYNGVLSVTGSNLREVKKATDEVRDSSGAMGGAYSENANTLENSLNSLKASAIGLVETMENSLGVISSFTETLKAAAQAISALSNTDITAGTQAALSAGDSVTGANLIDTRIKELEQLKQVQGETIKGYDGLKRAALVTPIGQIVAGNELGEFKQTIRELEQLREARSKLSGVTVVQAEALAKLNAAEADRKGDLIDDAELAKRRSAINKELAVELDIRKILDEQINRTAATEAAATDLEKKNRSIKFAYATEENKRLAEKNERLSSIAKRAQELATTDKERIQLEIEGVKEARAANKIDDEVAGKSIANLQEQIRLIDERNSKTASGGGGGGGGATSQPAYYIESLLPPIGTGFGESSIYAQLRSEEEAIADSYAKRIAIIESAAAQQLISEQEKSRLVVETEQQLAEAVAQVETARHRATLDGITQIFGDIASIGTAFGETGFKIAKAAAVAEATINMHASAVAAYKSVAAAPIVGPYLAPVAAAAALAAGAAQIASIKSQSYSGAYEHGGMIPAGKFGLVGEAGPELVQGPAVVTSARTTAGMGAGEAPATPVEVRVYNYGNQEVETRTTNKADKQLIEFIVGRAKAEIANDIHKGGNTVSKAFEGTYNMSRGRRANG